jgi:hypothetical protein
MTLFRENEDSSFEGIREWRIKILTTGWKMNISKSPFSFWED